VVAEFIASIGEAAAGSLVADLAHQAGWIREYFSEPMSTFKGVYIAYRVRQRG
jgi:hypothetical protein